jgi:catechol 2,3-dioxygenase-like lactoylglutathione lyase family enzyme
MKVSSQHQGKSLSRREALAFLGAGAVPLISSGTAQAQDSPLPLHTTGLEHIGTTVPDPEAAAKFYGRIFDPQLFQEREPPPRFYVRFGTAYMAFGGSANVTPKIDHICALVEDYKPQEMRKALEAVGVQMGAGPLGMPTDSDSLRLQLLGVPGGLARTVIPAGRVTQEDAAVQAIGLEHIVLLVSDLDKSAEFYARFFGREVSRTKNPARVWFSAAKTKLGLEQAVAGQQPKVDHFCLRVAGFDRQTATVRLKRLGVDAAPSNDEKLLRFQDLNGFIVELKGA